jgi:hypothetical protein
MANPLAEVRGETVTLIGRALTLAENREAFPCICERDKGKGEKPPRGGVMCGACETRSRLYDAYDTALMVNVKIEQGIYRRRT